MTLGRQGGTVFQETRAGSWVKKPAVSSKRSFFFWGTVERLLLRIFWNSNGKDSSRACYDRGAPPFFFSEGSALSALKTSPKKTHVGKKKINLFLSRMKKIPHVLGI